ncbi:MAG: hypothetical protein ACETVR_02670 [Candidatus Bathyarchaeia archaeon]
MEIDSLRYPFAYVDYFIPEFVARMRRESIEKPSPRQSISMYKLLLAGYMRRGHLSFQDLVEVAVVTSRVDNQRLAERVAVEILLDIEEEEKTPSPGEQTPMSLITPKSDEISWVPKEWEKEGDVELQKRYDSEVDIFKEFTNQPDLGVGPGEDELLKAYVRSMRKREDERTRRIMSEILKRMLLKLGREFERREVSFRNPTLRPYEWGEDPELIDDEGSMENIFDQGRRIEEIRYEDFLMRKREKRKRTIVYVQDISNTMFYDLEGLTSIHYSILSLVPLMWALRRERYGLALFESNSHILKDLYEDRDAEQLIDPLISLVISTTSEAEKNFGRTKGSQFWGGTVPNKSLSWALEELGGIRDKSERLCFFFSDLALEEPGTAEPEKLENYEIIEDMVKRGIRVIVCVSPLAHSELFAPYTEPVLSKIRKTGCEILETKRPSQFLEDVQSLLEGTWRPPISKSPSKGGLY